MKQPVIKYIFILLGVAVVMIAIWIVLFMRPLPVEVARAESNVPIQVFGLGTVEARVLSKVGFEVGAALIELDADHGDHVKRGSVLARLHSGEQEAQLAKARAGLTVAEATAKRAEAAMGKARAVQVQKRQTNKRKQELLAKHTVSIEVAEEAQMEQDVASAELAVAISDVDVAKAALADARSQYDYEKVILDHHVLRAPYDAIVVQRHKELGSVLTAGEPLFTLVAAETVWVLAYVDEVRAGNIRVGQSAEIRLRSLPREVFQGHVARIDIESDRVTEERRVYVVCERCPDSFHLGEQAEVFITTTVIDEALFIPEVAITAFDGTHGVIWSIEDGSLQQRKVEFGHRTLDSRLEVVGGLPPDVAGVTGLRPGLREGRAAKAADGATL